MARSYTIVGNYALVASATLPAMNIISTATVRPRIYDILVGSDAVADNAAKFLIQRNTTTGTPAGNFTPVPIDPSDPTAVVTCGLGLFSAGPTLTANAYVLQWAQNQRATFRWVAAPAKELIIPATATNGLSLMTPVVTAAYNAVWAMEFEE